MSISGDHDYAPTHTVYVQGTPGHRTDCRLDVPLRVQPLPSPEAEPSPELIAEWEADELSDRLAEEDAWNAAEMERERRWDSDGVQP